jgi:hypothetical protein
MPTAYCCSEPGKLYNRETTTKMRGGGGGGGERERERERESKVNIMQKLGSSITRKIYAKTTN